MFENTICCVYSNGGMPPVAPRLSTSTFKLTLRRFLRPFTCRTHRPQTPPPTVQTAHHRVGVWRKMGRAPDCPCARKSTPRQSGARPQVPINMQASDALTMCQRVSRQVNLGQLRAIDRCVDLRGRDIGMPQDFLQHAQVGTSREHVGGKGVAQRMRMEAHQSHLTAIALAYGVNALARQTTSVLI